MARPICGHCGAAYGQREIRMEVVVYPECEEKPAYRGNGRVVRERLQHARGGSGSAFGVKFGPKDTIAYRDIWDGESWIGGYAPFCTTRCAVDYARRVWGAGFRCS